MTKITYFIIAISIGSLLLLGAISQEQPEVRSQKQFGGISLGYDRNAIYPDVHEIQKLSEVIAELRAERDALRKQGVIDSVEFTINVTADPLWLGNTPKTPFVYDTGHTRLNTQRFEYASSLLFGMFSGYDYYTSIPTLPDSTDNRIKEWDATRDSVQNNRGVLVALCSWLAEYRNAHGRYPLYAVDHMRECRIAWKHTYTKRATRLEKVIGESPSNMAWPILVVLFLMASVLFGAARGHLVSSILAEFIVILAITIVSQILLIMTGIISPVLALGLLFLSYGMLVTTTIRFCFFDP